MKLILLCRMLAVVLALFLTTYFAVADTSATSEHWIFSVPFQKIEAGSFRMGSPLGERYRDSDEGPVQVQITKPFEIMTTEVTQSQWIKVMEENPLGFNCGNYSHHKDKGNKKTQCPNHPIERVSWHDVQEFIGKLNEALGLTGCDGTPNSAKNCYRLPTEAEWEYSARGGTVTAYFCGNDHKWLFWFSDLEDYAWYWDNSDYKTYPVGSKKPNPWGLYDVNGNVAEWV